MHLSQLLYVAPLHCLHANREKEKAQESLRLAADKFNAFVALTDRCIGHMTLHLHLPSHKLMLVRVVVSCRRFYDYWQDASQHQVFLTQDGTCTVMYARRSRSENVLTHACSALNIPRTCRPD